MMSHPKSRADRRNMKYKRGEYAEKDSPETSFREISKRLQELETAEQLKAAKSQNHQEVDL